MRGGEVWSGSLFSYVDLEARVRRTHPLRTIRTMVDAALARLDGDFGVIYAPIGRPSIPPEGRRTGCGAPRLDGVVLDALVQSRA